MSTPEIGHVHTQTGVPLRGVRWGAPAVALCRPCGGYHSESDQSGDALFGAAQVNWIKIALTYLVPYAVCTYGAVSYQLNRAKPTRNLTSESLAN
jgi:hypothetical protein